jgi:hypothetical protein
MSTTFRTQERNKKWVQNISREEPGQRRGIALGYGLDDRGFKSRQRLGIFLSTTASKPALGPTQPPTQRVPGALSMGIKWPGCEADHSIPSTAEVKECVELYLHSPIRLHGVVLH